MKVKLNTAAAIAAAVICYGSYASAATVKGDFVNVNPSLTIKYSTNGSTPTAGLKAGQMNWKEITGGSSSLVGLNNSFSTYCIDIFQVVGDPTLFNMGAIASAPTPASASGVIGTTWLSNGKTKERALEQLYKKYYTSVDTAIEAAAFQMAIWKIVFETTTGASTNLGAGQIRFTGAGSGSALTDSNSAVTTATTWLNFVLSDSTSTGFGSFVALTNVSQQDQVYYRLPLDPAPVPIPLPAASIGGLVIMGMISAKRALRA